MLLLGIGGCCICLCIEAAAVVEFVKSGGTDLAYGKLGVAGLYLFNVCYNLGVDVGMSSTDESPVGPELQLTHVFSGGNVFYAEVFPNHIRHMGVAITNAVLALTDLVYLQVTALAFENIGYKYFLVSYKVV